jgi:hypothetical protein
VNLTPEKIKTARTTLKRIQIALILVLLVAVWASTGIAIWQKIVATVLAALLLSNNLKKS